MTHMHRVIFVLTGLLFLVGSALLLSGNVHLFGGGGATFADEKTYETERGKGALPQNAPDLPPCARDVAVEKDDTGVTALSFTCAEKVAHDAFVAQVKNQFLWNIFLLTDTKIRIERAGPSS